MRLFALLFIPVLMAPIKGANVNVNLHNSTAVVGETVTADISIVDVADLYAFQFDLVFDPDVLAASDIRDGHFLDSGGFFAGFIDNALGTITFITDTLIGPVVGTSGSGTLAQIQFMATGRGTSLLSIVNPILLDSHLSSLPVQLGDSQITVDASASAVPEPATGIIGGATICGILFVWSRRRSSRCL